MNNKRHTFFFRRILHSPQINPNPLDRRPLALRHEPLLHVLSFLRRLLLVVIVVVAVLYEIDVITRDDGFVFVVRCFDLFMCIQMMMNEKEDVLVTSERMHDCAHLLPRAAEEFVAHCHEDEGVE